MKKIPVGISSCLLGELVRFDHNVISTLRSYHMTLNIKKANVSPDTAVPIEAMCQPDREARIAELAYLKAESRGFEAGQELEDWLEAEANMGGWRVSSDTSSS